MISPPISCTRRSRNTPASEARMYSSLVHRNGRGSKSWKPPTSCSLRMGHHLQLHQAPLLLLLQVLPALLHVDVVPRQQLRHRPVAVDVEVEIDADVAGRLPPQFG